MVRTAIYRDAIREAAASSVGNRLRSFLGALAIAVAVGTIAVVIEGLHGFAQYSRLASARAFGSDTFVVARVVQGELNRRELAAKLSRNPAIHRADVRFLDRYADDRVVYAPIVQRSGDVTAGERRFENAAIGGTAATLFQIRDLGIARGRFLRRDEEGGAAQVAVIGADVADTLFPDVDPIGRSVRIARRGFEVVGVQARQGSAGGVSLDRNVWIPLQAFERAFGATESLQVFARAPDPELTDAAEDRAVATMRARRQLRPGVKDNFDLLTPEAARSFVLRIAEQAGAAAAPISVMALLAAIVVVTNTTLVSVTQRTREIGVRRAVGATRGHVIAEVLAEASLIAITGGAAGLLVTKLMLAVASGPIGFDLPLRFSTIAWSLGASGASGLAAGWYPARRASRVDVIAAIRLE
jgi:putative ABC transport system permease protein